MSETFLIGLDTLEGASARHNLTQGWHLTQVANIERVLTGDELAAGYGDDTAALFERVLAALITIVGDRGSQCPFLSVPTYLEEFVPEIVGVNFFKVRIVYRGDPLAVYEFDGALNQVETNKDTSGEVIKVGYYYDKDYPNKTKAGHSFSQGCLVSVPMPEPSFTFHPIITAQDIPGIQVGPVGGPRSVHVAAKSMASATEVLSAVCLMQGSVNNAPFAIGLVNGIAGQWMLTRVRGASRDGGASYEAGITFEFRAVGWNQKVTYIDPETGKPPSDLVEGVGTAEPETSPSTDFSIFNIWTAVPN